MFPSDVSETSLARGSLDYDDNHDDSRRRASHANRQRSNERQSRNDEERSYLIPDHDADNDGIRGPDSGLSMHDDDDDGDDGGDGGHSQQSSSNRFILILTFAAGISGLLFGYDTGVISSTLVSIGTSLDDRELTTFDKSTITASTSLFALFASPVSGILCDKFGRRFIILVADVFFILGALWQAFTGSVVGMVCGRSFVGLAVGAASLIIPLYISELSPSHLRGRLVTINSLFITGGQVVAYIAGWLLSGIESTGWRWTVGLGAFPAVIQLGLLVCCLPETPRWLVHAGRDSEARRVMSKVYEGRGAGFINHVLRGIELDLAAEQEATHALVKTDPSIQDIHTDGDDDDDDGDDDGDDVLQVGGGGVPTTARQELTSEPRKASWLATLVALFRIGGNRRALTLACMLQALQQLCGFNSIMYFSATIFQALGFTSPTLAALSVAFANFLFTFAAFALVDRLGRRRILLLTIPIMAVALLCISAGFYILDLASTQDKTKADHTSTSNNNITNNSILTTLAPPFTLVAVTIYTSAFATGLGPIPWQQSELFPLAVRATGSALATATNYTSNLLIGASFLPLLHLISAPATFAMYAVVCVVGWVVIWLIYPEVSGLGLEDVRELLADGWGVRESVVRFQRMRAEAQ